MKEDELTQSGRNAEIGIAPNVQGPNVQVFVYPCGSGGGAIAGPPSTNSSALFQARANGKSYDEVQRVASEAARAEFDRRLAEETRRSFEVGREQGRKEGRQAEREAQASAMVAAERERLRKAAELVDRFDSERERYFAEVESEVVALAMAVSARILRREAQMDPLLLTGAVRVALGQLSASTTAQLVVPPNELELWTEAIAHAPNLAIKPNVVAGEGMHLGECLIKTDLGSVDLGIRSQLGEIERGFFDRVGTNGSTKSARNSGPREAGA